jgi:mgtE-like transporter
VPRLLTAALLAGLVTVVFVLAVAYYGTLAAFRVGLDPDSFGIPIVTSSVDFVGALSLVVAIASLGIA